MLEILSTDTNSTSCAVAESCWDGGGEVGQAGGEGVE